jgi:hypothetical protein
MTVSKHISKYKFNLVGVQVVRWDKGITEPAGDYSCFCQKENENHKLGTVFFIDKKIISAVKRAEFVSDRMSYIILRGHWCGIIVLNVPTQSIKLMIQGQLLRGGLISLWLYKENSKLQD